jgi:ankyrin repeat protein
VQELGADINITSVNGMFPLFHAVNMDAGCLPGTKTSNLDVIKCLVGELGADVNQARHGNGHTALLRAAVSGKLEVVRCLLKLRADINLGDHKGMTPLMTASVKKHAEIVKWLIKAGAETQAYVGNNITAASISSHAGASAEQTAYLEAKTHCSKPGCSGAGIMKCTACKQARYCQEGCQLAHWKAHKADCKRWRMELDAGKSKGGGGK